MGSGASTQKSAAGNEAAHDGPSEFATARQHFHKVRRMQTNGTAQCSEWSAVASRVVVQHLL